jgi:hypothetical protein
MSIAVAFLRRALRVRSWASRPEALFAAHIIRGLG